MKARSEGREPGGRRIGSAFSGEYRITAVDVLLIVLGMALLVGSAWRLLLLSPERESEAVTLSVRFRVADVPDGAEGKISVGDLLYTERGEALGSVESVAYIRQDGVTMRAYMDLHFKAQKCPGGYKIACGKEEKELLLSIGQEYPLHTAKVGAIARCIAMNEEPA